LDQHAPESAPPPADPGAPEGSSSPYKNLFIPLIVVPAAIVGAIVLVFLFFGAIAGHEASVEENLDRVISGGAGDHTQAAFNLVRQLAENQAARNEGRELPWPVDERFLPRLQAAWEATPADDKTIRLVLAGLAGQLGDPDAVPKLVSLLESMDAEDTDGVQFHALANLGALGDARATPVIVRYLEGSADDGLRSVAAVALQRMPGEESRQALVGALDDRSLEVRANAALSLSVRGDAAGARVLRELLKTATYTSEHDLDARKYAQPRRISESRVKAVEALGHLKIAEDQALLAELAESDKDLAVREAAMKALAQWPGSTRN
jgi:hypothetical protein